MVTGRTTRTKGIDGEARQRSKWGREDRIAIERDIHVGAVPFHQPCAMQVWILKDRIGGVDRRQDDVAAVAATIGDLKTGRKRSRGGGENLALWQPVEYSRDAAVLDDGERTAERGRESER